MASDDTGSAQFWDTLNPTAFNSCVYIPCLKLSIAPGSFVMYNKNNNEETHRDDGSGAVIRPQVGRVLESSGRAGRVVGGQLLLSPQSPCCCCQH